MTRSFARGVGDGGTRQSTRAFRRIPFPVARRVTESAVEGSGVPPERRPQARSTLQAHFL
mgnify:CR=1 FL=1|jgi:hypothetical protein